MSEIEIRQGKIIAVCQNAARTYPKYAQESVYIGPNGIEGDAHAGAYRRSYRNPLVWKPNDRAISIVANEVRKDLNMTCGLNIQWGGFNENLLVEGIGDLSDINWPTMFRFESGVELVITGQNDPCAKLSVFHRKALQNILKTPQEDGGFYNRRGLVAMVLSSGELFPGDTFIVGNFKHPSCLP